MPSLMPGLSGPEKGVSGWDAVKSPFGGLSGLLGVGAPQRSPAFQTFMQLAMTQRGGQPRPPPPGFRMASLFSSLPIGGGVGGPASRGGGAQELPQMDPRIRGRFATSFGIKPKDFGGF